MKQTVVRRRVGLRWLLPCLALMLVSGCVPARLPDELAFTPGPPVTVTDNLYSMDGLRLRYPVGWRVVTGPAENPLRVFFVAPDDAALIVLSPEPIDEPPLPSAADLAALQIERRELSVAGLPAIYAALVAPQAGFGRYLEHFEAMVADTTAALR